MFTLRGSECRQIAIELLFGRRPASDIKFGDEWRLQLRPKGHALQCRTFTDKALGCLGLKDQWRDLTPAAATSDGETLTKVYWNLRDESWTIADSSSDGGER